MPTGLEQDDTDWAAKGVWTGLFEALASPGGPPAQALIDSSAAKAHRFASGGKDYDSDAIRQQVEASGPRRTHPPKVNRHWKPCFSPDLYRGRNAIERKFCRIKDFRRIGTRDNRLATNYRAAVCLAATVRYWL